MEKELNREQQIVRAYECCHSILLGCNDCPFINDSQECVDVAKNVLVVLKSQEQRIKELAEENERLREDNEIKSQKRANIFEIANAFDRGRTDGVRKMQERLKAELSFGRYIQADQIDQIAKEILEGKK